MDVTTIPAPRAVLLLFLTTLMVSSTGCAGMWAQMLYWKRGGPLVPADYAELEGKRVAVICVSDTSGHGVGTEADALAREVGKLLSDKENIKDVDVVRFDEVADWIDRNGWDEVDYREIGRGVKAEAVVAIDMGNFRIHEGTSLYRGRATLKVAVFDMLDGGREVYRKEIPEFTFPVNGPKHAADVGERQFRRAFVNVLASHIAKLFYDYDLTSDFSRDSPFIERS